MGYKRQYTSALKSAPQSDPEFVARAAHERMGQVERSPSHARASTVVQVEEIAGAAQGPDGYMHPFTQDAEGNLYVIDGRQLLVDLLRGQRILIHLLAKLADVTDPFELDIDQDDDSYHNA